MKIILSPDSFKGSMSAREAVAAMGSGIRRVAPETDLVELPLADGGEGTLEALVESAGGCLREARVSGPHGIEVSAYYGLIDNGMTAVVETASAAGLSLVPFDRRDPRTTTTYGVGELIMHAFRSGARKIVVGLGGSATNDGGAGALQALGVQFFDRQGNEIGEKMSGGALRLVHNISTDNLLVPRTLELVLASDVVNPLLGPQGASAVYGPQKGATPEIVAELEEGLRHLSNVIRQDLGVDIANRRSGGAAGGLGAGLMAVFNAKVQSGIELVLDLVKFNEKARGADFVFTGEGKIDQQTTQGKAIAGVLARCRTLDIPLIAFAGSVELAGTEELLAAGLLAAVPILAKPTTLVDAMSDGPALLEAASATIMRLLRYQSQITDSRIEKNTAMSSQPELSAPRVDSVEIFTDGACVGNPGPGGYGVIVKTEETSVELSAGFRRTTNNRMELLAAIVGLQSLPTRSNVTLYSDSQYLVNGIKQGWAKKWRANGWMRTANERAVNSDLWSALLDLCDQHSVEFRWVRGHAGHPENERCDRLSVAASKSSSLQVDELYERAKGRS